MDAVSALELVLALSVLLQFIAAGLALRLIPLSQGHLAWLLVALAQVLMAVRRGFSLWRLVEGRSSGVDPWAEGIALAISASMALSMYLAGSLFLQRRRLEEQLRQAEKMEALGRLAGGVAHDFNNQLLVIMGHADELARTVTDREQRASAELIMSAAQRSAELTRNLLTFSRKMPREASRVDVHALIEEVEALLKRTLDPRIEVSHELRAYPAIVSGDPGHLQNMLLNLAINGRDAMPGGGQLTFSTDVVEIGAGGAAAPHRELSPGRYVAVGVTDSGTGIDAATRAHLFEPFFTTKAGGKGTGLGLASVYATARAHHGAVDVDTAPGRGSTFRVLLPIVPGAVPVARPSAALRAILPSASRAARIMVVEDEEPVRNVLVGMLARLGHETVTCADGLRAIETYAREWRSTDLVILDTVMPNLGGAETLEALLRINPDVRVIVCSGYAADAVPDPAPEAGMVGYLHKPFVQEELSKILARALPTAK